MTRTKAAYSLVELLIVVIFLGIIAAIAVPRLNFSAVSKLNAETVARKIVTDLRRTRRLAISSAAVNTTGFELTMTGSAPYTGYKIQNLDTSETIETQSIDSGINCTGGSRFQFGPLGNLLSGSDSQLIVSASGKTCTIKITAATGMIKCTEN
jgi:Tfp pilus assembly protein FimT